MFLLFCRNNNGSSYASCGSIIPVPDNFSLSLAPALAMETSHIFSKSKSMILYQVLPGSNARVGHAPVNVTTITFDSFFRAGLQCVHPGFNFTADARLEFVTTF
jgi:hypothetical protein